MSKIALEEYIVGVGAADAKKLTVVSVRHSAESLKQ